MTPNQRSLITLHTSVLLLGIAALFSKLINLSAADINFFRSFITVAVIGFLLAIRKRPFRINSRQDFFWMMLLGTLLGLHWITYFHAMQVSSIAIGVISLYTFPLITVFLEPLVTKEKLHKSDVFFALLGFFGIYLMVPDFSLDSPITTGVAWGLLSALLFALRNVWQKHRLSHYAGDTTMLYQGFAAGLICLIFMETAINTIDADSWLKIIVLGTLFTALPHSLFVSSLRKLKAKTASLIACMQPVYSTVLAFIFLSEKPDISTLIGGTIIIGTSMLETYRSR